MSDVDVEVDVAVDVISLEGGLEEVEGPTDHCISRRILELLLASCSLVRLEASRAFEVERRSTSKSQVFQYIERSRRTI